MLRYAITGRVRLAADEPTRQSALLAQAARLAADGIDFIQLREKDLPAGALTELARRLVQILGAPDAAPAGGPPVPSAPILLINSRADIAIAVRAGGVHLPSGSGAITPAQVRALYTAANLPAPIVSLSCHTLAEVARAVSSHPAGRPTHILFGPLIEKVVFEKVREDRSSGNSFAERCVSSGLGLDRLRAACLAAAPIPVLALGGVTAANAPACLAAGAGGIASIRLFLQ